MENSLIGKPLDSLSIGPYNVRHDKDGYLLLVNEEWVMEEHSVQRGDNEYEMWVARWQNIQKAGLLAKPYGEYMANPEGTPLGVIKNGVHGTYGEETFEAQTYVVYHE